MDAARKSSVSEQEILRLKAEIDRRGYGAIENFIEPEELAAVRAFAASKVQEAGGEYVAPVGPDVVRGTLLGEISQSPEFADLCQRLFELATGKAEPKAEFYQVLRCLQGSTGRLHSSRFHYDSYILTVIIPVAIPETGSSRGDLVLLRNARTVRESYFVNLLDKFLVDNPVSQWVLRQALRRNLSVFDKVRLRLGAAYFIWGYRTIHTNEPCDEDKLRVTAIFHYGDPHARSLQRRMIRSMRKRLGAASLPAC
jgi:hypothetical protein